MWKRLSVVETGKFKEVARSEERRACLQPAGARLPVVGQKDKPELRAPDTPPRPGAASNGHSCAAEPKRLNYKL